MTAITWKDVVAPNFQGVSSILNSAGSQLRQGLSAGQRIIDGIQDRQDEGVQLNTDQFMDMVRARYQSPDAIAQAQASGELDQLRSQFSGLDRKQSGAGAIDSLVGNLQDRAVRDQAYADNQTDLNTREDRNTFATNLAANDFEANKQLLSRVDFGQREAELIGRNASAQESNIAKRRAESRQALQDSQQAADREYRLERRGVIDAREDTQANRREEAFKREEEDRIRNDEFQAKTSERFNTLLEARGKQVETQTKLRDIALQSGVSMDVLSDVKQHKNLPEAVLQQIAGIQEAFGEIGSAPSTESVSNDIMKMMLDGGATFDEATRTAQSFDSATAFQERASAAETQANQREIQALAQEYPSSSAVQDSVNQIPPVQAANEIMGRIPDSLKEQLNRHDLQTSRKKIAGLMDPKGGMEYNGKLLPVSGAWIESAINLMDNSGTLFSDKALTSVLDDLIRDPDSGMLSDLLQGQQFRERQAALVTQQSRNNLDSYFKAINGIDAQGILDQRSVEGAPKITDEVSSFTGSDAAKVITGFHPGVSRAIKAREQGRF